MISIVAALTSEYVIGKDNQLPWSIPDDLKHFKETTRGGVVIMGRKTFESLKKPLPNRVNIVVSSSLQGSDGYRVASSLQDAVEKAKSYHTEIFVIGGASIFKEALSVADRLILSWVKKPYEGDVYFPHIDFSQWKEVESKEFNEFVIKYYLRG